MADLLVVYGLWLLLSQVWFWVGLAAIALVVGFILIPEFRTVVAFVVCLAILNWLHS
jgi:hypothetical protein